MKNVNQTKSKMNLLTTLALSLALLGTEAFAQKAGNGGDGFETIAAAVTKDLKEWILDSKLQDMNLYGLKRKTVITATLKAMETAKITFTDEKLKIGHKERTCLNYPAQMEIVCNRSLFKLEMIEGRYILLAHEYFGLAGIEGNNGDDSDYRISSQIREFVEYRVVIRTKNSKPKSEDSKKTMAELEQEHAKLLSDLYKSFDQSNKAIEGIKKESDDSHNAYLKDQARRQAEIDRLMQAYEEERRNPTPRTYGRDGPDRLPLPLGNKKQ